MKLKIEIREGPPSMFNPEAIFYVVATHEGFRTEEHESDEKMMGGPMTERNAVGMIDIIRETGLPKEVVKEFGEPDLPPEPPRPPAPKPVVDRSALVPVIYIALAIIFVLVVSHFGMC